ncbi:MAG: DUF937 domain-containing protein [Candidatus Promineifilaceae bacterium]
MATNIVAQITEALAPAIVDRIASGLGLNKTVTQKAIVAAIPALLGALISYVSKPQGATKLNDVVRQQEPGLLSSLANVVGGSGQKALVDQGSSVLTALLGKKILSGIGSAVGQYAGIGESSSKSLMGLLGPVVLGVLGHEQRDRGLDASGLANLLTSQRDTVQAALPSGFSKYLSQAGILDDVVSAAKTGVSRTPAKSSSSSWTWWLGVLAALLIALFAWRLLSTPEQTAEAPSPQIEAPYASMLEQLKGVTVGDVDVGELAAAAVNNVQSSLEDVKDEPTARAALPKLNEANSQFEQLNGLLDQMSPDTRALVAKTFAAIRPTLDQLLDKALAIPGVGIVIKPTADAIRAKLETLATA